MLASSSRLAAAALLVLTAAACSDDITSEPNAPATPEPIAPRQVQEQVVPGEILIKMKGNYSLSDLTTERTGLRLERRLAEASRVSVLGVARGTERAEAARLAADPRVEYAQPNYIRTLQGWEHYNPGGLTAYFNTPPYAALPAAYSSITDADIDAVAGVGSGGSQVIIGSLDTGVDAGHPELTGKLILGWDWVNNDANPADDNGHGTHTIGSMVGTNTGVAGVTSAGTNVQVHVQKVCNAAGSCPTAAIVNAIYAAANYPGMVAMNLSIGGASLSPAEAAAINYSVNTMGVLVIAAAGNNGSGTVACPACDPNAISVAATNWRDAKAYYSQYGPGLDMCAPGGELYSNTTPEMGILSSYPTSAYAYLQGTSMATPQVTGAAGVVASVTGLRSGALRSRLETYSNSVGAWCTRRLNVYSAITTLTLPYPL
jgi:subtilisin family serine protease